MPNRHSEVYCPSCLKLVKLQRSIDAMQPLTWFMVDDDGRMHERTCKPVVLRRKKPKPVGPLLPVHEGP